MNRILSLRIVATGVVLVMQIQTAKTQVPNPTIDSVMREIRQAHAALASVECDYVDKTTTTSDWIDWLKSQGTSDAGDPELKESHIHWAFKGGKSYRREETPSSPNYSSSGSAKNFADIDIFDGEKNYSIIDNGPKSSGQANISRVKRNFISPLSFGFHFNGEPLEEVLAKGRFLVSGVTKDPILGDIVRVEGDVPDNGHLILYLCPAKGWLATRIEVDAPTYSRKSIYVADKTAKFGNVWLPVHGTEKLLQTKNSSTSLLVDHDMLISNIKVNKVNDKLFLPVMKRGTVGRDGSQYFRVGANDQKQYFDGRKKSMGGIWVGLAFMASLTSLIVLAVGALIKWRRKAKLLAQ